VATPVDAPKTSTADPGPAATPTAGRDPRAAAPAGTPPVAPTPTPSRTATDTTPAPNPGAQANGSPRNGGGVAVPPAGNPPPDPSPPAPTRTEPRPEPAPETPRDTVKMTVPPPGTDLVEIAEREIRGWIEAYKGAYAAMDAARVKAMNPASTFRPAQYNSASVSFSNVDIQPREDGKSAVLHADVQYQYGFKRGVAPPPPSRRIVWRMRKTPNGWVVED
jgi:hypothetical protein